MGLHLTHCGLLCTYAMTQDAVRNLHRSADAGGFGLRSRRCSVRCAAPRPYPSSAKNTKDEEKETEDLVCVAAAAEVEAAESAHEEDGLEAVEDAEEEVVEEGEAAVGALPPPGVGEAELPRPAASPTVQLPEPTSSAAPDRHPPLWQQAAVGLSFPFHRERGMAKWPGERKDGVQEL
ncbi:hypothetical protein B296_00017684 [Ensete ventricosum]|uniref:Uncharacterized protein n=1 Tax=Ensete ventricosum TaxID=4639 RepID=A0A427AS95_ENSVE|nr:hypothetical protein B296_00017684 [Ensete ventricosum]